VKVNVNVVYLRRCRGVGVGVVPHWGGGKENKKKNKKKK